MRKRVADQKLFEWPRPIRTKSTAQLNGFTTQQHRCNLRDHVRWHHRSFRLTLFRQSPQQRLHNQTLSDGSTPRRSVPTLCESDAQQYPPPLATPAPGIRRCFPFSTPRVVFFDHMLSRAGDVPQIPKRLSSIKPPEPCTYCNSTRLVKKGTRKKKLERVPLYRCRACGRTFAAGPLAIRNKTFRFRTSL